MRTQFGEDDSGNSLTIASRKPSAATLNQLPASVSGERSQARVNGEWGSAIAWQYGNDTGNRTMADQVETMAYAGSVPWHTKGERADDVTRDIPAFLDRAGLNWGVELVPLQTTDTQAPVTHKAVRRTTDASILGVVGPRYVPLQNVDALNWFSPFVESGEATMETAGSLRSGSRIWALAKINREPMTIAPGDTVEKFLLLSHSHDGSLAVRAGFSPIRVVCQNTLSMAHGVGQLIRMLHTKSLSKNLEDIRDIINMANAQFEATAEQYRSLCRKSINNADLRKFVKVVLEAEEDESKLSTRLKNQIADIMRLCEFGKGNQLAGVRGTYWAAYNGVTEWVGTTRGNSAETRLDSQLFGTGADMSKRALETALAMAV